MDCDLSLWEWVYCGLEQDLSLWHGVPEGDKSCQDSLVQCGQFIAGVTLCIEAVVAKMTFSSKNKASIIIRLHPDHGGCQHGGYLLGCIGFLNSSNDFRQSLMVLFVNLSCGGVSISKSFNKNADGHKVIVKGASLSCCLEAVDIGSESFIILLLYFHKV